MHNIVVQCVAVIDRDARRISACGQVRHDARYLECAICVRELEADNSFLALNLDRTDAVDTFNRERPSLRQRLFHGIGSVRQVIVIEDQVGALNVEPVDRDPVVRTFDGDDQRRRTDVAITVGQGICKLFRQGVATIEALHPQIEVIEHIAVAAISVQHERAIFAGSRAADRSCGPAKRDCGYACAIGTLRVGGAIGSVSVAAADPGEHIAVG